MPDEYESLNTNPLVVAINTDSVTHENQNALTARMEQFPCGYLMLPSKLFDSIGQEMTATERLTIYELESEGIENYAHIPNRVLSKVMGLERQES